MPEGQQGPEALTAAHNKKCLDQIIAITYNMTETKQNKNPRLTEPYILVAVASSCLVLAAHVARSETGSKWRQTGRQTYGHQTLFRDP